MSLSDPSASMRRETVAATPHSACPSAWAMPPNPAIAATSLRAVCRCLRFADTSHPEQSARHLSPCLSPLSDCNQLTGTPGHGMGIPLCLRPNLPPYLNFGECRGWVRHPAPRHDPGLCVCVYVCVCECSCARSPVRRSSWILGSQPTASEFWYFALVAPLRNDAVRYGTARQSP